MKKQKITVYDYSDATHNASPWHYNKENPPEVIKYDVEAYCVGGPEGVKAYFVINDMLYTAYGDDGGWWLIGKCHINWLTRQIDALLNLEREVT